MATIKEVAKLAGVSIGTVSNVLNGKTSNAELIDRVESAMSQLSYRPDANARSLKNTKSKLIGVLMPEICQSDHAHFLSRLENLLREQGYGILLKISNNNWLLEKKNLTQCMEQCVDGIIWYSPAREQLTIPEEKKDIPYVIVTKYPLSGYEGDQIQIDYRAAVEAAYEKMRDLGMERIGVIFDSMKFLLYAAENIHSYRITNYTKIVDSRERAFQAAYELLYQNPELEGIIAGNSEIAAGIERALELLERKDVRVFCCKESQWAEQNANGMGSVSVSQSAVAEAAVSRLMDALEQPYTHECLAQVIPAVFEYREETPGLKQKAKTHLKFALYDSPAARGLQMYSQIYTKKTGVRIFIDLLEYKDLESLILRSARDQESEYDGFMIDVSWLEEAATSGGIACLTGQFRDDQAYLDGFIDGMVREYGMFENELYALPFMSGTQILVYQKDLFEDPVLKRQFSRNYDQELLPPTNWAQYNLVSEFFTRTCNPKSPVHYGNISVQGENIYNTIGFLNRLWAYGAELFDSADRLVINSPNALAALKNYMKSFQFSNPDRNINSWDAAVAEYCKGDTAMAVFYDSHAMRINDYTRSKVAGNIGSMLIPGGVSVLGGWSLGLNQYGHKKEEAFQYLKWVCSEHNSIPLSLLGGSTVRKSFYLRPDMEEIYPWKKQIPESYEKSRKRRFPKKLKNFQQNELYTRIIPHEINRALCGEITEEEALSNMEMHIKSKSEV